jgi:hypothetical protein
MNFRIEFLDNGILRDCTTDNHFTAATLFDVLQSDYPLVYWYRVMPNGEEDLYTFYRADQAAA